MVNRWQQCVPLVVKQRRPREVERPPIFLVNRDQDTDQVVHQVREENLLGEDNIASIIERIMAQNCVNTGL